MAPIDPVRTAALLAEITVNSSGSLLEELIDDLFGAIPGVQRYAHDRISANGNEEIDLAYSNTQAEDGLVHFGSDLLVECKSQGGPVSAQDVNWFAYRSSWLLPRPPPGEGFGLPAPRCGGPCVDWPLSAVVGCRKRQQDVAPC